MRYPPTQAMKDASTLKNERLDGYVVGAAGKPMDEPILHANASALKQRIYRLKLEKYRGWLDFVLRRKIYGFRCPVNTDYKDQYEDFGVIQP